MVSFFVSQMNHSQSRSSFVLIVEEIHTVWYNNID